MSRNQAEKTTQVRLSRTDSYLSSLNLAWASSWEQNFICIVVKFGVGTVHVLNGKVGSADAESENKSRSLLDRSAPVQATLHARAESRNRCPETCFCYNMTAVCLV